MKALLLLSCIHGFLGVLFGTIICFGKAQVNGSTMTRTILIIIGLFIVTVAMASTMVALYYL